MQRVKFKVIVNPINGDSHYEFFVLERKQGYVQHYPENFDSIYRSYSSAMVAGQRFAKQLRKAAGKKVELALLGVRSYKLKNKNKRRP